MTILISAYVTSVCLFVYFLSRKNSELKQLEFRLRNVKRWLDEANEDQFAKGDALRAAYKTIDRLEAKLAKLAPSSDEQTIEEFAAEIGAELDCVHEIGLSEDEIISYYTESDCACEADALNNGYTYDNDGNLVYPDFLANAGTMYDSYGNLQLDRIDWTPQDGTTYSESDDSDV